MQPAGGPVVVGSVAVCPVRCPTNTSTSAIRPVRRCAHERAIERHIRAVSFGRALQCQHIAVRINDLRKGEREGEGEGEGEDWGGIGVRVVVGAGSSKSFI